MAFIVNFENQVEMFFENPVEKVQRQMGLDTWLSNIKTLENRTLIKTAAEVNQKESVEFERILGSHISRIKNVISPDFVAYIIRVYLFGFICAFLNNDCNLLDTVSSVLSGWLVPNPFDLNKDKK
ncbi:hypothetical protein QUF81_00595 [Peribacillus simplex]|uniref:hypothetical protein n=1 Tax=Peribacillus simplex TaxID=1478 RepID=UPI0025A082E4|nr:hypothetical protein [Peribacillus simplex]MDM5291796.1 hypothetical protein [Peribacillus simplex]